MRVLCFKRCLDGTQDEVAFSIDCAAAIYSGFFVQLCGIKTNNHQWLVLEWCEMSSLLVEPPYGGVLP
jgi:hypothetical protein